MALTKAHLRRAVGALLVYDISNLQSFNSIKEWLQLLRANAEQEIVIALVGNKCDIMFSAPEKRLVTKKMGEQFANDENIIFLGESSALAGINIKDIIEHLVNSIHIKRNILLTD
jgi:GTPase SAR1 family protein